MKLNKTRKWVAIAASGAAIGAVAFLVGRAWAGGIPATAALTYSGLLEDVAGVPLTGDHPIEVKLWNAAMPGTTPLCETQSTQTLAAGRFSTALPDACTDAIRGSADVWVEVAVDGVSLGTTKLGAVPYAVEAGHAVSADGATNATNSASATNAAHASSADSAANATHATTADTATHAGTADTATSATTAASAATAAALSPNTLLSTPSTGALAASASTTQSLVLDYHATYVLSASLFGGNTDVHQTWIVHVPGTPNLNVGFAPLLSNSFSEGSIQLSTQDGNAPSSSYGYNTGSNATLELKFTAGPSYPSNWTYALARLM